MLAKATLAQAAVNRPKRLDSKGRDLYQTPFSCNAPMASHALSPLLNLPGLLGRLCAATGVPPEQEPDFLGVSPEHELAQRLGLSGTIRLAEALDALEELPLDDRPEARELFERSHRQIAAAQTRASAGLGDPLQGKARAPSPEELREKLIESGAFESHDEDRWKRIALDLAPKFLAPYVFHSYEARRRLRWLREDVGAELRGLGGRAALAETFDRLFFSATEPSLRELLATTEKRLHLRFCDGLLLQLRREPEGAVPAHLHNWYEQGGTIQVFLRQSAQIALALIERESDAVRGLLLAAIDPYPTAETPE